MRLTRDVNNNPLYRPGNEGEDQLEDETGRMGRFKRRFENSEDVVDFASFGADAEAPKAPSKPAKCMLSIYLHFTANGPLTSIIAS